MNENILADIKRATTQEELDQLGPVVGADPVLQAALRDQVQLMQDLGDEVVMPTLGEVDAELQAALAAAEAQRLADIKESYVPSERKKREVTAAASAAVAKVAAAAVAGFHPSAIVHIAPAPTVPRRAPNSRTELGNVERLLSAHGENLMYAEDLDAWFEWSGVYWERTTSGRIIELATETVKRVADEASSIIDDDDRIAFLKFAAASQKKTMIANMAFLAAADARVRVKAKDLDSNSHLLGTKNGAVDLRTGAFVAPDRKHRITVVAGTNYDPAATCPIFQQTVVDSQGGDMVMVAFMQRLLGHTLMGNPKEEIMVIPYGNGGNGKSTIFGAVRIVLGDYARAADAASFMNDPKKGGNAGGPREDVLRLRGARFVYVSEPEENSELKESFVKAMTGGDAMPARGVNAKMTVEVMPTWVPVMPTNHRPIIKGDDFAIWRRMVLLPFLQKFSDANKDTGRKAKLLEESEGILTWLVQGAMAYQAEGLKAPKNVSEAKEEYKRDMDLLGDWLDDCCELDPTYTVATDALWASWQAYADARGELGYIKSQKKLSTKLTNRNNGADFKKKENLLWLGKRARGFSGLRLKKADAAQAAADVVERAKAAELEF